MNDFKNDIVIREAISQDSALVRDLIFDIWLNEYHFAVEKNDCPDLLDLGKYYNQISTIFLVAVYRNRVIGTIACDQLDENDSVLKRMFVKRNFRGRGIAQRLLDALVEKILSSNESSKINLYLSTKADLAVAAKQFYLKNKFFIVDKNILPDNFPFFYEDDLFMRRIINKIDR